MSVLAGLPGSVPLWASGRPGQGLAATSWPVSAQLHLAFRSDRKRLTNKVLPLPSKVLSRNSPKTFPLTHLCPLSRVRVQQCSLGESRGSKPSASNFPVDLVPLPCNIRCCNILGARVKRQNDRELRSDAVKEGK